MSAQALGGVGRAQEEAAWHMRARCWRGVTSARVLAGLCAASRSEDSLGTAQLTEPSIGAPLLAPQALAVGWRQRKQKSSKTCIWKSTARGGDVCISQIFWLIMSVSV